MIEKLMKSLRKLFGSMGDEFVSHFIIRMFERVTESKDKTDHAAKVTAEVIIKAIKGERPIEAYAIMISEIRPYWRRAVRFFQSNGGNDQLERVVGDIWTSCQNGVFYFKLDGKETVRYEAGDGKELFVSMMKEIFRLRSTDEEICTKLEMCHQASPWERLVNLGRRLGEFTPSLERFIRAITFTRPGFTLVPNPNPTGRMFLSVQETDGETTARAIRRLTLFATFMLVVAVCIGIASLVVAIIVIPLTIYHLIVTPFGESTFGQALSSSFWLVVILLVTMPIGWRFARRIGLVESKKTYATAILAIAVLAVVFRLAVSAPRMIHDIRVASGNIIDMNSVFMNDGTSRFCRPIGEQSPTGEGGDWWLEHVYTCNAQKPGFSRIGVKGRSLTSVEGFLWLNSQKPKPEQQYGAQPIGNITDPVVRTGMEAMKDQEAFMEKILEMGYADDQVGSIILLAPTTDAWSEPVNLFEEMEEYFEQQGGLKPNSKYFTMPISAGDLRIMNRGKEVTLPESNITGLAIDWGAYPEFQIKAGRLEEWLIVFCNGLPNNKGR